MCHAVTHHSLSYEVLAQVNAVKCQMDHCSITFYLKMKPSFDFNEQ